MNRLLRGCSVLLLVLLPLLGCPARAAIDPQALREGHPECLLLQIRASHEVGSIEVTQVSLVAEVLEVFRSATGLQPGDLLLIVFAQDLARVKAEEDALEERLDQGWVGPQIMTFPPVLPAGTRCIAHLGRLELPAASGPVYTPLAHQYSFEEPEARAKYLR